LEAPARFRDWTAAIQLDDEAVDPRGRADLDREVGEQRSELRFVRSRQRHSILSAPGRLSDDLPELRPGRGDSVRLLVAQREVEERPRRGRVEIVRGLELLAGELELALRHQALALEKQLLGLGDVGPRARR